MARICLGLVLAGLPGCSAVLSWSDSDLVDAGPTDAGADAGDGGDARADGGEGGDGAADGGLDGGVRDAAPPDAACERMNETQATATLISSPLTLNADLCRFGDHDWYKFSRAISGTRIDIRATFNPAAGDVDLRLYNQLGTVIGQSITPTGSSEEINLPTVFGATFYVEVFDDREMSTAPYTLTFTY
jgi:hypothetical protein